MEEKELIILSPFDFPDIQLVLKSIRAGAFGILYLGDKEENTKELISTLSKKAQNPFGICVTYSTVLDFALPENLTKIIAPVGYDFKINTQAEILYQVTSLEEAEKAISQKATSIVIKGKNSTDGSTYDIFRKIIVKSQKNNIKVYIQDNTGVHTSAAFLALGAHGIIFDSQVALFPECSVAVPEGENTGLAEDLVERYKSLRKFISAVFEAAYGHLHQAKNLKIISYDDNNTKLVEIENNEQKGSCSKLMLWERQIIKMLYKEKNLSKFSLVFSNDVCDAFFAAFVSIMAAPAGVKGIKIKIATPEDAASEETISIRKLQADTQELLAGLKDIHPFFPASTPLDIAVVGMECIYPGAADLDEYWRNILTGKDCVSEIPVSHWNKDKLFKDHTTDTDYSFSKWGGFIPTIDFDPVEFGIMPQSLFKTEPSHLLSLLVVKRALKDAGYNNLAECDFENTSIFMGTNGSGTSMLSKAYARWTAKQILGNVPEELNEDFPKLDEYTFPGFLPNILSGRIANRLNFGGRNYTVDAACASSLAALDIACRELSAGLSDMVVMGGADLENTLVSYLMFSSMHILTSKAYCAPFDAEADGIIMGEGVGALILKRLEDAENDGNKIYAVIKGISGSSDGRNMSITAPGRKGESRALERAYQIAGVLPSQVGLIEAHGTGTVAGDRVELATLTDLFLESGALPKQTVIGSVKSQIGHTKCAAGVAGLIKSILSVYHGITPPTIHLDKLNAFYDQKTSPFVFNKRAGLWNSDKRIAGISAFGFGGTNFHAIIKNYTPDIPEETVYETIPSELFVFKGDTPDEAKTLINKVKKLLSMNNSLRLADIAYSLALYNDKVVQVSIIAGSVEELLTKMNAVLEDRIEFKIFHRNVVEGKVAFLFSGEGSQYINMARDIFVAFPRMRRLLNKHSEYIRILFPETAFDEKIKEKQKKVLTNINNALPIIGIVDLAIAEYLQFLGITPDMTAGHSYGELPALCFSGVITPDDLIAIGKARANLVCSTLGEDKGKLIAVLASEEDIKSLLENEKEVRIVNYNSPKQIVLAGTAQGIKSFVKEAEINKIICREINVSCALYHPFLTKAEELFADVLKDFDFKSPEIPVWANTTAEVYPNETGAIKKQVVGQLVQPVEFTRQIENMYEDGARIFIETGPGRILLGLVESILGKKAVTIQTDNKSSEGFSFLLRALAQYLSLGKQFHIEKLFEGRNVSFLSLDEPEQYRKSLTGWLINGNQVYPSQDNKLSKTQKNINNQLNTSISINAVQ
jgi:acyl transferase domain-containing protein